MNLGFGELLLIFIVILLIFGASKLPQLGDALIAGSTDPAPRASMWAPLKLRPHRDARKTFDRSIVSARTIGLIAS